MLKTSRRSSTRMPVGRWFRPDCERLEDRLALAVQTFVIDPLQSFVEIQASVNGVPATEQAPNSLLAHFSGNMSVDVNPTTLRVLTSPFTTINQLDRFLPGNQIVNAAAQSTVNGHPAYAVVTNLNGSLSMANAAPLDASGQFDAFNLRISTSFGPAYQFSVPNLSYGMTLPLGPTTIFNQSQVKGSLTTSGGVSTLTTPIYVVITWSDSFLGATMNLALSGQIVASTVNPDAPVGVADSYSTPEETPLVVAAPGVSGNDSDPQGNPFGPLLMVEPQHGQLALQLDGSFVYTPNPGYSGPDRFVYVPTDGTNTGFATMVTVNVTPTPDPPTAFDDAYTAFEGLALYVAAPGVLANDTDPDGGVLTALLSEDVEHGTLSLGSNGSFVYIPDPGFKGLDEFTYSAVDATGLVSSATVRITVNHRPVSAGDAYQLNEDATLIVPVHQGVLANDTDEAGHSLTASLVSGPSHGTLSLAPDGSFVYTPFANYFGSDQFTYKPSDGFSQGDAATVLLTITPVDDPPAAVADAFSVRPNQVLAVAGRGVLANDFDVDSPNPSEPGLTVASVTAPLHGQLVWDTDGTFYYRPNPGFSGVDTFTYAATDGITTSEPAVVSITVEGTPVGNLLALPGLGGSAVSGSGPVINAQAPGAGSGSEIFEIDAGAKLIVTGRGVLANDGAAYSHAKLIAGGSNGQFDFHADGSFSYSPNAGFASVELFSYRAGAAAIGLDLYTVNWVTDRVLRIDNLTGAVSDVGPIGHDMFRTTLAFHQGLLYALTSNSNDVFGNPGFTLVAINPTTGAKVSSVPVKINGQNPRVAFGITSVGTNLYVSYNTENLSARMVGKISPSTGAITQVANYNGIAVYGNDLHDIASGASGELFGFFSDINGTVRLWRVGTAPAALNELTNFGLTAPTAGVAGMTMANGSLELLDIRRSDIHHVDSVTGARSPSTDIASPDFGSFWGLAYSPQAQSSSATSAIFVRAQIAPVASAGAGYSMTVGQSLTLDATASTDANAGDTGTLIYSWDVNGDGVFGDAYGAAPTLSSAQLQTLGLNGPMTVTNLRVRVSDAFATTTSVATTLTLVSPPPAPPSQSFSVSSGPLAFLHSLAPWARALDAALESIKDARLAKNGDRSFEVNAPAAVPRVWGAAVDGFFSKRQATTGKGQGHPSIGDVLANALISRFF